MLKKIRIVEGGDTGTLPGTHVNVTQFTELNREALKEGKHPAVGRPILLGITKASLELIHSYLQHHSKKLLRS